MRVGFIGLGSMSNAVSRNILRAGFDLVVHDVRAEAQEPLVAAGATAAATPKQVIELCDVVGTMVFGPKEIEAVARGEEGLFAGNCDGKVWLDLTTSRPVLMRELGVAFSEMGGQPVDAPVTGSLRSAIRGDMIMFVGGTDDAVARARPVLDAIGEARRVGGHGNGYVAKLVNNQLWKIHAAAVGEAMVTAKLAGLEPEVWWEVMKGGAADSFVLHHDVPAVFAGHYDPSFRLALCLKDLDLIAELLEQTGTRADLTQATHERFREAARRYGEDAGDMSVCRVIEGDAGVELRVERDWVAPWEVKHASEA